MAEYPYWNEDELTASGDHPTFLAIGDSWFWYPLNNMLNPINNLLNLLSTDFHAILVRGANGASTKDLTKPDLLETLSQDLSRAGGYGETIKAAIISGSGNDIAGEKRMKQLLNPDCSNATTTEKCINQAGLNTTMQKIRDNYATLIELAHSKLPTATIFIHSYDHPIPDSKALRQPMRTCKVPVDLQRPLATELFDRLADLMNAIASTSDKIEFVDCRNTLTDNDWLNELHPTPLGFDKLARPWEIALRERGFLSPR